MFDHIVKEKQEMKNRTKYFKNLGWNEFDSDGDKCPVYVLVLDVEYGYNVFRSGSDKRLIGWFDGLDLAVEAAVDYARKEIADHEIKQQKKETIDK
jgi:hypothetical protein